MANRQFDFTTAGNYKTNAVQAWREGNQEAMPEFNASGAAVQLTKTPLGANGVYTQVTQDRLDELFVTRVRGIAFADHSGTLYVDESQDGVSWTPTDTVAVSANQLADTGWVYLSKRFYRLRYVNGANAQTFFALYQSVGVGLLDVSGTMSLSGSNVPNATFSALLGSSITVAAGTSWTSPAFSVKGYTRALISGSGITGTSPNYGAYLWQATAGNVNMNGLGGGQPSDAVQQLTNLSAASFTFHAALFVSGNVHVQIGNANATNSLTVGYVGIDATAGGNA